MKFGVVVFPGSNCDADCYHAVKDVMNYDCSYIWHQEENLTGYDALIIPGGFSYGDYLRCGAIARFSPVMNSVRRFVDDGGLVIGICNGFQILSEAGLLPGVLLRNKSLKFMCKPVQLKVNQTKTPFTANYQEGQIITLPIAHGEGNYYCDADTLEQLKANRQIVFTYCDGDGQETHEANPNGSLANIAGIINRQGNVLGMMPHPERYCDGVLGGTDGIRVFKSLAEWMKGGCSK